LGWNKYFSALFIGGIVFLYTTLGGLKVDVLTDVFQGILMLIIVALVFMVDTSKITSQTILPILTNKTILYGALSIAFAQFLLLILQPELWQRVVASRSLKDLKIGIILSWILLMIIWVPMTMIGLSARASGLVKDPSTIFYDILQTTAPPWFFPFLIVALFAAFMSTLDSSLFAISSQLGKYGFLVKKEETLPPSPSDESKTVKKIRVSMTAVLILALIASLFFANFLKGVFGLISLMTVLAVALVMALLLKISSNETFIAILLSILAFLFAFFGGYITDEKPITTLYPSFIIFGYILLKKFIISWFTKKHNEKVKIDLWKTSDG
jgi:SSS family solute:Na+ symporter/sodium/proline symporter